MEKREHDYYQDLLMSVVFDLEKFPNKSGMEGVAYFIDENFVVKELTENDYHSYADFEQYCRELQNFHKKGYNFPEIYAWTRIPKEYLNSSRDKYYILEEFIKGKQLYYTGIRQSYDECKDLCSFYEFQDAVYNRSGNLYKEIIERYIKYYIDINERLEASADKVFEDFALSDFNMMKEHTIGNVDVQESNLLFEDNTNRIVLIDNAFIDNSWLKYSDDQLKRKVMKDGLEIMAGNFYGLTKGAYYKDRWTDFDKLYLKHKKTSEEALRKLIKVINKTLNPIFDDKNEFTCCREYIRNVVDWEKLDDICEMLQRQ